MKNEKFYHNEYIVLPILCAFEALFLIYSISNLSISFYEAEIFYESDSLVGVITRAFAKLFGQNDYAVRAPFIILHFINCILLYKVSKYLLKRRFDCVISVMLYMILPGTLASSILVNMAGIIIFFTLLLIFFEEKNLKIPFYITLFITAFIDKSFFILYFCFFIYAFFYKKTFMAIVSIGLFAFMISFYNLGFEGKPKDYFLDTLGIFAATFSPVVFLFFVYTIYRIWLKDSKNLLFFIATTTFCATLFLSIRQKTALEMILPYCIISTPLIIRAFFNSYRVRLPAFRKAHKFFAILALSVLFISSALIIFNQSLYMIFFSQKPQKHFIYKYDVAKDLAKSLQDININCVNSGDEELNLRLKFYGINKCEKVEISQKFIENFDKTIEISKYNVRIAKFYVKMIK